jgi:alkylation response protein AidB-like acyl-CoA dehydrogenase
MGESGLLLASPLKERVFTFFEPRSERVEFGAETVREALGFLDETALPQPSSEGPNGDLTRVVETIATVAWSDLASSFSLWCHRMVLEYLWQAAPDSAPRSSILPRVSRSELLGSTGLAAAMAYYVSGAPLPITWRREKNEIVLDGRVSWASNLFVPEFVLVTAAANAEDGRAVIVAIPGSLANVCVQPYPQLLALQSTGSSSVIISGARLQSDCVISDDLAGFIKRVRPTFLLLQISFCFGLAQRALAEAGGVLSGVAEVLSSDFEGLRDSAAELTRCVRSSIQRRYEIPMRDLVQLRLDCARLATAAVSLEAKVVGGRGYVHDSPTARRLREAAFLPIQAPTEGQLRWELSRYAS